MSDTDYEGRIGLPTFTYLALPVQAVQRQAALHSSIPYMTTSVLLEDLTSQQLLRRLANCVALVFGNDDPDVERLSLSNHERAIFRSVLHQVAVTELWVTRMQFRQFFGVTEKGGVTGTSVRPHESLMSADPAKDRDAHLYQEAYRQLTDHIAQHSETIVYR